MTPKDFRRIAMGLEGVLEGAHMGHPDFRINNRIFATLHADKAHGMVKLTPEQQRRLLDDHPDAFAAESGAWGRAGCTRVTLASVDEETLGEALTHAWQNTVSQPPPRSKATSRAAKRR
jgi:hypothetical protein